MHTWNVRGMERAKTRSGTRTCARRLQLSLPRMATVWRPYRSHARQSVGVFPAHGLATVATTGAKFLVPIGEHRLLWKLDDLGGSDELLYLRPSSLIHHPWLSYCDRATTNDAMATNMSRAVLQGSTSR